MSCLAWDGKTLAADRAVSAWSMVFVGADKAWRLGDGSLVGIAGMDSEGRRIAKWIERGGRASSYPTPALDDDGCSASDTVVMHVKRGRVRLFCESPIACEVLEPFWAIGSGGRLAIGAMAHGATAREAVEIAARFDPHVGRGILELMP